MRVGKTEPESREPSPLRLSLSFSVSILYAVMEDGFSSLHDRIDR